MLNKSTADIRAYNNGARYYFDYVGISPEGESNSRHYYKTNEADDNGNIKEIAHYLPKFGKIVYMDCVRTVSNKKNIIKELKKIKTS